MFLYVAPYVKAACVLKAVCEVPGFRNKVPSFRSNVHCAFCFLKRKFWVLFWLLNKEEKGRKKKNSSSSFILLLPYFFFLFVLLVILFFFLMGIFSLLLFPLPRPMSSLVRVGSFLPYLCFVTIHAP